MADGPGVTWAQARAQARGRTNRLGQKGYLVTITSAAETAAVNDLLTSKGIVPSNSPPECVFIGCTDELKENEWKWVTGEPFGSYTSWREGAPDNHGGAENYGVGVFETPSYSIM